jgi:hypothetical protein
MNDFNISISSIATIIGAIAACIPIFLHNSNYGKSITKKSIWTKLIQRIGYYFSAIIVFWIFCGVLILNIKYIESKFYDVTVILGLLFLFFEILNIRLVITKVYTVNTNKRIHKYRNILLRRKFYKNEEILNLLHVLIINFVFSVPVIRILEDSKKLNTSDVSYDLSRVVTIWFIVLFLGMYLLYLYVNINAIDELKQGCVLITVFYDEGKLTLDGTDIIEGRDYYEIINGYDDSIKSTIYRVRLKKEVVNDIVIRKIKHH